MASWHRSIRLLSRESLDDRVYAVVPGFLIRPADGSPPEIRGAQAGDGDPMAKDPTLVVSGRLRHFLHRAVPETDAAGRNLNYWALWTGYKL